MTVEKALRILKLPQDATQRELLANYRKLVKRCHPDYNTHRVAWANAAMITLNLAYETASDFIRNGHGTHHDDTPGGASRESPGATRYSSSATEASREATEEFLRRFELAADQVFTGMYTYYQYGLENVHLRHEGVRRLRYRSALKYLRTGIEELAGLEELPKPGNTADRYLLTLEFARAFFQSMRIDKHHVPGGSSAENKAYRHYLQGSVELDRAIRYHFFRELDRDTRQRGSVAGALNVSYHELMTVLVKFQGSSWVSETVIKMYLLDVFTKLAALRAE